MKTVTNPTQCPKSRTIRLKSVKHRAVYVQTSCKTWACPYCSRALKEANARGLADHLAAEPEGIEFYSAVSVLADQKAWKQLYNKIARSKDAYGRPGRHLAVRDFAAGPNAYRVIATTRFPGSSLIDRGGAIAEIQRVISAIEPCRKPVRKSYEWRLEPVAIPADDAA